MSKQDTIGMWKLMPGPDTLMSPGRKPRAKGLTKIKINDEMICVAIGQVVR